MNIAQVRLKLRKLGFQFDGTSRYGVHKDREIVRLKYYHPANGRRDIYVSTQMYRGSNKSFYYITSHLKTLQRRKWTQRYEEIKLKNIFGSGITLEDALNDFEQDWNKKMK